MAAVKAAGGGGVDRRDQLLGKGGGVVCAGWEEMQDIRGDGEADQTWDRGRQEHDRALRGVLTDGQVSGAAIVGGLVALGELVGRPWAGELAVDGLEVGQRVLEVRVRGAAGSAGSRGLR